MDGIGEELNVVLDNVAAKLGVAVEELVPAIERMVHEVSVRGWAMCTFGFILLLLFSGLGWWTTGYFRRHLEDKDCNYDAKCASMVVGCFLGAGGLLFGLITIGSNLGDAVAPTLVVAQKLVELL